MLSSIAETLFVGKQYFQIPSLHSTNEYAFELLSKSTPPEGTAISTPNQYAGRGQIGSKWESEPDRNITMSIILYPKFLPVRNQFQLNIAISLAIYDFVSRHISRGVSIKWSNDIYVHDNKISGILIQNVVSGSHFQSSVIGIGLNINQTNFPEHLPHATSLALETGRQYALDSYAIPLLCQCIEHRYLALKAGHFAEQKEAYLRALYRYQVPGLYQTSDGKIFQGCITGISDFGKLLIEDQTDIKSYDIKEVKFI